MTPRWDRRDWAILLAITLLAAALRFYALGVVPPGFQFDEAYNALDTAQVMEGVRPLFLPANGGREVIYTYIQAAVASVLGLRLYTLRLVSALAGIGAVVLCYLMLRRLLTINSRRIAVFSSLALAVSFWHLHFSHYGIRVILMPVVFSGVFGLFWLGVRLGRLWPYAFSGALAGLSVWTNPTGRLVPIVLILYVGWLLLQERYRRDEATRRRLLTGSLLAGLVAFLVFLPLGLEFYRHPDFFFGHASGVSVFADRVSGGSPLLALARHALAVFGMFSWQGDQAWIHNLAGRPVFDPLLSIPFWIGVFVWLWRLRRGDPDREALLLLMLWTVVMLLPSVLSDDAPNFSRTLPSLPALFVAVGLGLNTISSWKYGPALAGAILLIGGGIGVYDYFWRFPLRPETYYAYDVDKLDAWAHLEALQTERQVYIGQLWAEHSTIEFLRRGSAVKSLDTSDTVVIPQAGQGAVYAFPGEQAARAERLAGLWPGVAVQEMPGRYGKPLLELVTVEADAFAGWPMGRTPVEATEASFAGAPTLLGMQVEGGDIWLFWRAEETMPRNLTAMLHLIGPDGERLGQADKVPGNGSYPTPAWTPGERVIERFRPPTDACAGGETVRVVTGWYDLADGGKRVPRADGPGDSAVAGEVVVPSRSRPVEQVQPAQRVDLRLDDNLSLLGFRLDAPEPQSGSPATLDLYWVGGANAAARSLTIKLHSAAGQAVVIWQGQVAAEGTEWSAGEALCRRLHLRLPADADAGGYRLEAEVEGQTVALGEISIQPSMRRFDAPAVALPVGAQLGDALRLVGLAQPPALQPGQPLTVTLVWQAVAAPAANYSVFVHLLDATGQIVAQSDATPAGGYATGRWLPGEFVVDTHTLTPTTGTAPYRLVAGMYDPITGERLPARDSEGRPLAGSLAPLGEVQ